MSRGRAALRTAEETGVTGRHTRRPEGSNQPQQERALPSRWSLWQTAWAADVGADVMHTRWLWHPAHATRGMLPPRQRFPKRAATKEEEGGARSAGRGFRLDRCCAAEGHEGHACVAWWHLQPGMTLSRSFLAPLIAFFKGPL